MQAAMTYLRVLREARKLSQADIARAAQVESKQVYRWERGESEPSASSLAAFVQAVRGNIEEVMRLILSTDATEDMGRQLARAILEQGPPDEREQRRQEAIALIDSLLADPEKIDRLLGYGERLREE
jgi:transcriptional regulator with XRE-family HTH domain